MAGVNKVILVGNLGNDPEVRTMNSGDRVCNLSIATSESWKDRDGNRQERTEWHRVVIFNQPLVDFADRYLRKGSKVYVEGKLQTRKWQDQSGADRYSTEIVLQPFGSVLQSLDRAPGSDDRDDGRGGQQNSRRVGNDRQGSFDDRSGGRFGGSRGGGRGIDERGPADEDRSGYGNGRRDYGSRGGRDMSDGAADYESRSGGFDDLDDEVPF